MTSAAAAVAMEKVWECGLMFLPDARGEDQNVGNEREPEDARGDILELIL